jgi:hypothetical protein
MVEDVAVIVGADVGIEEPEFAVLEEAVGVLEVGVAGTDGLDLGASEDDARLKFFKQEVVMRSDPIDGSVSFAGGGRVAAGILLRVGLCLMR